MPFLGRGGRTYEKFLSQRVCKEYRIQCHNKYVIITVYAPMIYTAPCVMFLMRAETLCGQVGGGLALEMESFLGPVKWHR